MSANCDYVYVEGLRFRTRAVSVVWKDADGFEHLVTLAKSGTGRAKFDGDGIPVWITPRDLKRMLKKGETIGVVVRATGPDVAGDLVRAGVRLRLDPRCAEGRSGRRSFGKGVGAGVLDGLPVETLRALAFEQLVSAPYGERNRGEAVERMIWSLGLLDDQSVALLLSDAGPGLLASSSRSSTPLELSSLLLSDERLVEKLIRDGKYESITLLERNSTRPGYPLADSSARPAHVVLEEVALKLLSANQSSPLDLLELHNPERGLVRMRAVGFIRNQEVLEGVLAGDPDGRVRRRAAGGVRDRAKLESALANDPDPSVRIEVIRLLSQRDRDDSRYRFSESAAEAWAKRVPSFTHGRNGKRYPYAATPGHPVREAIRDAATGDPDSDVRLHALLEIDGDVNASLDEREAVVRDVAFHDPEERVRLKALELLETDAALLEVATGTASTNPETSRAAYDRVFDRIVSVSVPHRRQGWVLGKSYGETWVAHTSELSQWSGPAQAGLDTAKAVAGSRDCEVLERLVDTLASTSFVGLPAKIRAVEVVESVLDNPAITDELYAKASALAKELTEARAVEELLEYERRDRREAERLYAYWVSVYGSCRDNVTIGLRHARAGNIEKAEEFLGGDAGRVLYAAAAGLSDADDIRAFTKLIDKLPIITRVVGTTEDFLTDISTLLRRNPATPADVLSEIEAIPGRQDGEARWQRVLEIIEDKAASLGVLEYALSEATAAKSLLGWYHVLTTVRDHPHASQEQVDTATELLEERLKEWSDGEPPSPN